MGVGRQGLLLTFGGGTETDVWVQCFIYIWHKKTLLAVWCPYSHYLANDGAYEYVGLPLIEPSTKPVKHFLKLLYFMKTNCN